METINDYERFVSWQTTRYVVSSRHALKPFSTCQGDLRAPAARLRVPAETPVTVCVDYCYFHNETAAEKCRDGILILEKHE
jgi:hypothetical protein